jgi:hypothetical protein
MNYKRVLRVVLLGAILIVGVSSVLTGCSSYSSHTKSPSSSSATNLISYGDFEANSLTSGTIMWSSYTSAGDLTCEVVNSSTVTGGSGFGGTYCLHFKIGGSSTVNYDTTIYYYTTSWVPVSIPVTSGKTYTISLKAMASAADGEFSVALQDSSAGFLTSFPIDPTTSVQTYTMTYTPSVTVLTLYIWFGTPSTSGKSNTGVDFYIDDISITEN